MMSWPFTFSISTDELVGDGEIRLDQGPPFVGVVSRLYVDNLDRDGAYVRLVIQVYPVGSILYIDRGTAFAILRIVAPPVPRIGYLEIPVACIGASATVPAGPVEVFLMHAPSAFAPRDAATDPALVTLDTAKEHLRIADALHDVDVLQKVAAASATIRDYLKDRNDPTWTPDTAPPWVIQSVLLLLAHLYEHRGDAFGNSQDNDVRVWEAIANLLRRSRDPALA